MSNLPAKPDFDPEKPPQWLVQAVQNQAQDIQIRREQVEAQKQQAADAHEYAKLALNAQAEDRKDARQHGRWLYKYRLMGLMGISTLIAIFVVLALCLNKDQIALEVIKNVATIVVSAGGGYAIGVGQGRKQAAAEHPQPPKTSQ
jgi:hypothetical protein